MAKMPTESQNRTLLEAQWTVDWLLSSQDDRSEKFFENRTKVGIQTYNILARAFGLKQTGFRRRTFSENSKKVAIQTYKVR